MYRPLTCIAVLDCWCVVCADGEVVVCIDLVFSTASLKTLQKHHQGALFRERVCDRILSLTSVSQHRINNIILVEGSVIFRFDLHPALYSDDGETTCLHLDHRACL